MTGSTDHQSTGPIHVSLAVGPGYEVPLAVALLTIAEAHEGAGVRCEASVLTAGVEPDIRATIEHDMAGRLDITWVPVDLSRLEGVSYTEGLHPAALYRILLPELLPAHLTRTIYFDADSLVLRPLTGLWQTELDGELLAAVRDAGAPYAAGPVGTRWREFGLAPDSGYFNSGMMLMALDQWRREQTAETVLDILRKHELRWGDQDALNIAVNGRWREVPRKWNVQTFDVEENSLAWALWRSDVEQAIAEPAVVQFTGDKPWSGYPEHPYAPLWNAALARSSFAGWSPEGKTVAARIKRRVTRAAGVLVHGK